MYIYIYIYIYLRRWRPQLPATVYVECGARAEALAALGESEEEHYTMIQYSMI